MKDSVGDLMTSDVTVISGTDDLQELERLLLREGVHGVPVVDDAGRIVGVGRGVKNLETALSRGIIDEYSHDAKTAVEGADFVLIATPVDTIQDVVEAIAPSLEQGAVVTDVGSVKGAVVELVEPLMPEGVFFVGAHPVAGTEQSGADAAFPTLFRDRVCIITPTVNTDPEALNKVQKVWEGTGSRVVEMDGERHDLLLASISHLPHVVVYALVNTVAGGGEESTTALNYSAGGFADFTRIASSSPEMWRDICLLNREALLDLIGQFQKKVEVLKELIAGGDGAGLLERFREAKDFRDLLKESGESV